MERKKTDRKTEKREGTIRFSKKQITDSKRFESYRDFLCGYLLEDKEYTPDEVDEIINTMYKEE